MGSMSNEQRVTIPMRNGVTDFGGAFKTDLEPTMQQACKTSPVATLSVHYPKGSTIDLKAPPRSWSFKIVNRSQNKEFDHDCVNIPVSPIRPGYRLRSWIRVENVLAYRRMDILLRLPLSCSMCCRNLVDMGVYVVR
jgi:hypothetical protein